MKLTFSQWMQILKGLEECSPLMKLLAIKLLIRTIEIETKNFKRLKY